MIIESLKSLAVPIDQLRGLPNNPRIGDVDAVARSLSAFGQRKPIVARNDDGTIIAGNHTWQAAKKLGWTEIAVAYVGDDDVTAKAYALADNRTAELGSYDEQALKDLIEQVHAVVPEFVRDAGWSEEAVKELVAKIESEQVSELQNEDEIPELEQDPVSKLGDLWQVGLHRILCGDSFNIDNLKVLIDDKTVKCILTDPPYGINLNTDWSQISGSKNAQLKGVIGSKYKPVANDDKPFDATFFCNFFSSVKEQFWFGADYYRRTIPDDDLSGSWLVWDKRNENSDSMIGSAFELIWSKQKHKRDLLRFFHAGAFSVDSSKRVHPTQKPIQLLQEILNRWTEENSVVIDLFAGSGATLVAAAKINRIGLGIELDPYYVDIIVQRLEKATGEKAVLVQNAESAKA
jgi:DNA modification methylase